MHCTGVQSSSSDCLKGGWCCAPVGLQEAGDHGLPARIPVHEVAIPHMGLPLLDNANFERLAATCAELGRYEFMLTVAPLVVLGGTGSPVNPIATF